MAWSSPPCVMKLFPREMVVCAFIQLEGRTSDAKGLKPKQISDDREEAKDCPWGHSRKPEQRSTAFFAVSPFEVHVPHPVLLLCETFGEPVFTVSLIGASAILGSVNNRVKHLCPCGASILAGRRLNKLIPLVCSAACNSEVRAQKGSGLISSLCCSMISKYE